MPTYRVGAALYVPQTFPGQASGGVADVAAAVFGPFASPPLQEAFRIADSQLFQIEEEDVGGGGPVAVRELVRVTAVNAALVANLGSETDVDDVLCFIHASDFYTEDLMVSPTPGTWTQRALADIGSNNSKLKVWTRAITSAGAQSITVPQVSDNDVALHAYVLSGADPADPVLDAAGTTGASSTSHVAPSVNGVAGGLLISAVITDVFTNTDYTAVSGGMTDLAEDSLTPASVFANMASARQSLAANGATGTRTFTCATSEAFGAISIAFNPAPGGGGTTPVSQDLDLRWRTFTVVTQDLDIRWRAAVLVTQDLDLRWRTAALVTQDLDLRWRTASVVTADLDLRWRTSTVVTSDLDLRWRTRQVVTADVDIRWRTAVTVSADLDLRWRNLIAVTQDVDLRWKVLSSLVSVSQDLDLRWRTQAQVTADLDLRWRTRQIVTADVDIRWRTRVLVTADVDLRWRTAVTVLSAALDLRWRVFTGVLKDLELLWVSEFPTLPFPAVGSADIGDPTYVVFGDTNDSHYSVDLDQLPYKGSLDPLTG